jgi:GNAT superfamily N-acetyltransferase
VSLPAGFVVQPATSADAVAVHAVMMAAGMDPRSSWMRSTIADIEWSLGKGGGFIVQRVVQRGADVVGCVGYRPDGYRTLTLNKLATRPEVRGLGMGAALVQAVEAQARRGGYQRVLLAVSQYNLNVISFYEHLGYAVSSDDYAYAHPDSPPPVVLIKSIQKMSESDLFDKEIERLVEIKLQNPDPVTIVKSFRGDLFVTRIPFIRMMMQIFGIGIPEAQDVLAAKDASDEELRDVLKKVLKS